MEPEEGSWELLIYSQSVRSPEDPDSGLASEVGGSFMGLRP